MAPHVFGGPLSEKDHAMLERCGIPFELAEEAVRRVDSATGAAMFGRSDLSADYAGIIFLERWPGDGEIREYMLRRDHPDLEDAGNGKVKEKNKYVSPPGRSNQLYFAPRTAPGMAVRHNATGDHYRRPEEMPSSVASRLVRSGRCR